jgi:hypothetical protein
MRNPLNEEAARLEAGIEQFSDAPHSGIRETVKLFAPYANVLPGCLKSLFHLRGVVTDATRLRWILAGDQVPMLQRYSR